MINQQQALDIVISITQSENWPWLEPIVVQKIRKRPFLFFEEAQWYWHIHTNDTAKECILLANITTLEEYCPIKNSRS